MFPLQSAHTHTQPYISITPVVVAAHNKLHCTLSKYHAQRLKEVSLRDTALFSIYVIFK